MSKTALVAVGGNSLIRAGEKGTIVEQVANARRTARAMVGLIRLGYRLVVTHGNGPQVGAQLLRSERASDVVYGQTLDVCGAASQGEVGYLLEQALRNELSDAHIDTPVVSMVTQTVVSPDDPAMQPAFQAHWTVLFARRCRGAQARTRLAYRGRRGARLSSRCAFARAAGDCGAGHHSHAGGAQGAGGVDRRRRHSGGSRQR